MDEPRNFYDELTQCIKEYPELVFTNNGYEEIPYEIKVFNAEGFLKVEAILKVCVKDFVRFQNFKPRKDGSIAVRCQTHWAPHFTGVSYFPLDNFQPGHPSWSTDDAEQVCEKR